MFGRNRDKWKEPAGTEVRSEYDRARWAAEGEGAGATKAAWVLGGCLGLSLLALTAVGGALAVEMMRDDREFVVIRETSAGEQLGAALATGRLEPKQAVEEWLISRWIDQVRGVPLDAVAFNRQYFEAQMFMCGSVHARIDAAMKDDPDNPAKLTPVKMIEQGISRRVHVRNITHRGGGSYRIDWTETLYHTSAVAGSANATADLEVKYHDPLDPIANPYGLYVCAFDWDASPT